MTKSAEEKRYTKDLSDVYDKMEDLKIEAKAILDAAQAAGLDVKSMAKVAKELLMDSSKLADKYAAEHQLELFRVSVGIRQRKGIEETVG